MQKFLLKFTKDWLHAKIREHLLRHSGKDESALNQQQPGKGQEFSVVDISDLALIKVFRPGRRS